MKIHTKEEFFFKDYVEINPKKSDNSFPPDEISKEDEEFQFHNTGNKNHDAAKNANI